MNEDQEIEQPIEAGAAGAPEGAVHEPTDDDVAKMYDELGIKAPKPTGKTKGRPKSSDVRAKNGKKDRAGDSDAGKPGDDDDKSKPKNARSSGKDGGAGDDSDAKGSKDSKDSGKIQDESGEADDGVRKTESESKDDSKRRSEEDAEQGDDGARQEKHESDDEAEEGEDAEGKRPGKSNPKIEQRFQRLTSEVKERDQEIAELRQKLEQATQEQFKSKAAQEDPEYTIEDFLKVRDEEGNILDLDRNQAELAWRRWKDGYDARSEQRNAEINRQMTQQRQQEERAEQIMRSSVQAYDHLANMMDEFPELVSSSGKFDEDFAAIAMPIINDAIVYAPGTEPGNQAGNKAIIVGLKVDPKKIIAAMKGIREEKRSLPLNGVNDNVELRSNVNVPHSRSSDPTIKAANDLYKELNIDKRL